MNRAARLSAVIGIACVAIACAKNEAPIVLEPVESPASATVATRPAPLYEIAERQESILHEQKQVSLKVFLLKQDATDEQIKSILRSVAANESNKVQRISAYWPGDDTKDAFSAACLEWGKNGGGWNSTGHLQSEEDFTIGPCRPIESFKAQQRAEAMVKNLEKAPVQREETVHLYRDTKGNLISEQRAEAQIEEIRSNIAEMRNEHKRAYFGGLLRALEEEWARIKAAGPVN